MLKSIILVFIGGGLGSCVRFIISKYLNANHLIPFGTFTVNFLGSLLVGLLLGWAIKTNSLNSPVNLLLVVGFCGGFTTFSSFSFENFSLLKSGDYMAFTIYFAGSLVFGLLAVFSGIFISRFI